MTKVALRGLGARKLRAFTTWLAIFLGVALVAGTYVLTDTINESFSDIFSESLKGTDVAITTRQDIQTDDATPPGFPARLIDRVRQVDGVRGRGRLGLRGRAASWTTRATRSATASPRTSSPRCCPTASRRSRSWRGASRARTARSRSTRRPPTPATCGWAGPAPGGRSRGEDLRGRRAHEARRHELRRRRHRPGAAARGTAHHRPRGPVRPDLGGGRGRRERRRSCATGSRE